MLKIAICDDEPFMLKELVSEISGYMDKHTALSCRISSFADGKLLLDSGCDFDLIFLDIQMKEPDGMETARMLRARNCGGLLIFVTVLKECVFDAFEVQTFDYLLKPIDKARLERTLNRAVRSLEQSTSQSIMVQKGNSCRVVPLEQILYCEVISRKIYLHLSDGQIIDYYEKLEKLETRIGGRFFRCHRSYLVNLDYVQGYLDGLILLPQNIKIPVSRLRERDLAQALLNHMKERRLPANPNLKG